jgi:hypothetical protein
VASANIGARIDAQLLENRSDVVGLARHKATLCESSRICNVVNTDDEAAEQMLIDVIAQFSRESKKGGLLSITCCAAKHVSLRA